MQYSPTRKGGFLEFSIVVAVTIAFILSGCSHPTNPRDTNSKSDKGENTSAPVTIRPASSSEQDRPVEVVEPHAVGDEGESKPEKKQYYLAVIDSKKDANRDKGPVPVSDQTDRIGPPTLEENIQPNRVPTTTDPGNKLADDTIETAQAERISDNTRKLPHSEKVRSMAFSRNANFVASVDSGGNVWLWDTVTGAGKKVPGMWRNRKMRLGARSFSGKGTRVVLFDDRRISVWESRTMKMLMTVFHGLTDETRGRTRVYARKKPIVDVCISPHGSHVIASDRMRKIKMWDADTGVLRKTITGSENVVDSTSSDRTRVVTSGDEDATIEVWNAETAERLTVLHGRSQSIVALGVSPDGTKLISSSTDRTIKVWDLDLGESLFDLTGHIGVANALDFNPDATRIYASGHEGEFVWDTTGVPLYTAPWEDFTASRDETSVQSADGRWKMSMSGTDILLEDCR
ncbi:MAG: hypothetical protein KDB27_24215 [Planctomycetales bacterium]|nr:hypothetical protein [Planctomycetales bacterium]